MTKQHKRHTTAIHKAGVATGAEPWWVQSETVFSNAKGGNEVQWFVDGEDAMRAMTEAIESAANYIWITDWWLTPSVVLRGRGAAPASALTLLQLLAKKAKDGRDVRVLLWDSVYGAQYVYDDIAGDMLKSYGIKFNAQRPSSKWSNHQKTLVVDDDTAFLGGIDLCRGRWDRHEHPMTPMQAAHSLDPRAIEPLTAANPFDSYNPCKGAAASAWFALAPRMPWHDVHLRIRGPSACDVARNFYERWQPLANEFLGVEHIQRPPSSAPARGDTWVQIVRSISPACGGKTIEADIADAYSRAIRQSKHFVYIENQYFISGCPDNFVLDEVRNPIFTELADRLERAIADDVQHGSKHVFRVIVVLPVHPEGELSIGVGNNASSSLRSLFLQLNTIRALRRRVAAKLKTTKLAKSVEDYLSFFCLRGCGTATASVPAAMGRFTKRAVGFTEQIYVHSKLMIVDDNAFIIGSANINERSLAGDRDSEISAIVVDVEGKGLINGKWRPVRTAARALRKALWREHWGEELDDPVSKQSHEKMLNIAADNMAALVKVFAGMPRNAQKTFCQDTTWQTEHPLAAAAAQASLKGHALPYPTEWLSEHPIDRGWYDGSIDRQLYSVNQSNSVEVG